MKQIIECVPNFSEGTDPGVIAAIVDTIRGEQGVRVLDIDTGAAANRTVVTFAGEPQAVTEAAFRAVQVAASKIDMRRHEGEHPRIGSTDVLPLVPVAGVTLEECVTLARGLGERVGQQLGIPVYLYEAAARADHRRALETIRQGEYEGLEMKLQYEAWKPDFGPAEFNESVARTGACIIGARNFLGAVNFNLAPTGDQLHDTDMARRIAREIRSSSAASSAWSLPCLKAIGWWIQEYGFAQVATNLTDMHVTGLGDAYRAVETGAARHGMRITGTEVIGLLPEWALTDAAGSVDAAVEQFGLDTMQAQGRRFVPQKKIIERLL